MYTNYQELIQDLISRGYEGDYWDYKEEWHSDNEKLIHDILCFSNTSHDRDCYLIVGVSDNGDIKGINNRKKQADVVDMLRSIQFAGDSVPNIEIMNLRIEEKDVDVLIIKNSDNVPFYIKKRNKKFNKIQEGYIYTRTGDSNTPINQNSNYNVIESLWKKRIGIDKPVKEKILKLLADKVNWEGNIEGYYHTLYPEYNLLFGEYERDRSPMFYSALQTDTIMSYEPLYACYNGMKVHEFELAILDGGRYLTNIPERGFIYLDEYHQKYIHYRFFTKGTIEYNLHRFLFNEESDDAIIAKREFSKLILYFDSFHEKQSFENHVYIFREEIIKEINDWTENGKGYYKDDEFKEDVITSLKLKEVLSRWKNDF
ncbi:ATP-binding protein [Peribacillus simplex]|uniref:AlbA family DNA-binding domain-containing protein n=1 Tax=Peribacillus simplex TaxID=1478 RepID=UPI0019214ADA|nr:ATP-binding protein [Peribacillus simplex]MBD8590271.1 ATP-binding protein [Peribacillus simplex]